MECGHVYQGVKQTFIVLEGSEIPSSTEMLCLDCGHHEIKSQVTSFYADNIQRISRVVRDDRKKREAIENA